MSTSPLLVHTDGACSGNPGPGGWGAVIGEGADRREMCGGEPHTTNNRMEMMAVIMALESIPPGTHVKLVTDSKYTLDGMTKYIFSWRKNGWTKSDGQPVKNADLWQRLDPLCRARKVDWNWVKGHAGDERNERADQLARDGLKEARQAA